MTLTVIIILCTLLLISYLFDLTSSRTKIPSIILLLLLGWSVRQMTILFDISLPDFSPILPVLGTIGLILIVLEGSLELEFDKARLGLIIKSFLGALIPMIALAFLLAFIFQLFGDSSLKDSLTNAIPFCVISSAIAIPSVRNLSTSNREFVIYESSLSDILGILFFNFLALNKIINRVTYQDFFFKLLIITIISFVATIGLSFLLSKIEHHIKYVPIILLVVLIYAISKIYHLPALVFILIFGLSIGNLDKFKKFKWIEKLNPDELEKEVKQFKVLTIESAFLIRSLFFLLFGYLLETKEVLNTDTLLLSLAIVLFIFVIRWIQLKLLRLPLQPLLYIAPRGLITILLFLSIEPKDAIPLVNKSLIIQVIILTTFLMMIGFINKNSDIEESSKGADVQNICPQK